MILVSVGTPTQPFDRLLEMVEAALSPGEADGTVWQIGASSFVPRTGRVVKVLPPSEFQALLQKADAFVCHAGEGSVMEALRAGKLPIVCARRRAFGEHVNDHQLELAEELGKRGLLLRADTVAALREALGEVLGGRGPNEGGWDLPRIQPAIAEVLSECQRTAKKGSHP